MPTTTLRTCSTCHVPKLETSKNYRWRSDRHCFQKTCLVCAAMFAERYQTRAERQRAKEEAEKGHAPTKVCRVCGGDPKPLKEFYRKDSGRFGVEATCITCKKIANAQWHRARKAAMVRPPHTRYEVIFEHRKDNPRYPLEPVPVPSTAARGKGISLSVSSPTIPAKMAPRRATMPKMNLEHVSKTHPLSDPCYAGKAHVWTIDSTTYWAICDRCGVGRQEQTPWGTTPGGLDFRAVNTGHATTAAYYRDERVEREMAIACFHIDRVD